MWDMWTGFGRSYFFRRKSKRKYILTNIGKLGKNTLAISENLVKETNYE